MSAEAVDRNAIARAGFEAAKKAKPAAFFAPDRASVGDFHVFGMTAGGRDNGPPGLRPQYHDTYYAAYLLDPDGNNVEAVHHG